MARARFLAAFAVAASVLAVLPAALFAEPAPKQGTSLLFRKSLFIHETPRGKVFVETRAAKGGESLSRILSSEYGIPSTDVAALVAVYRELNPGSDPEHLAPGETVRIPFKFEERVGTGNREASAAGYSVRRGESLWRILKKRGVTREQMPQALAAVARANPKLRDLNHLEPGQRLELPKEFAGRGEEPAPLSTLVTILGLLKEVGCEVGERGEYLLDLGRGRSLRFDAGDFPLIVGPGGRRVVLDVGARMSPALTRAVEKPWGVSVVRGRELDPEKEAERILPRLGFHELASGPRTASLGRGLELRAAPQYTLIARAADVWEGKVHLLFARGSGLDADTVRLATRSGFAVHLLGGEPPAAPGVEQEAAPPQLPMADPVLGAAELLRTLGVPHRVREEVECGLDGGIRYRVRPDLVFEWGGLSYAIPPAQPARAEAMLERGGYLTVPWRPQTPVLDRLADLLLLIGVPVERGWVEAPGPGAALRLRVQGLTLDDPKLAATLGGPAGASGKVLLTEANLPPEAVRLLRKQAVVPWVIRTDR